MELLSVMANLCAVYIIQRGCQSPRSKLAGTGILTLPESGHQPVMHDKTNISLPNQGSGDLN